MNEIIEKINQLKCNVEGCCAQIQQNLIPQIILNDGIKKFINDEVSDIDKYMSQLDGLIARLEKANEKQTKRIKFE